jgi:hypothetical protein
MFIDVHLVYKQMVQKMSTLISGYVQDILEYTEIHYPPSPFPPLLFDNPRYVYMDLWILPRINLQHNAVHFSPLSSRV